MRRNFVCSFCRFYSSTKSLNVDLSDEESKRRLFNRLLYRSRQRGFLELGLILGKWVEDHINSMDENGIKSLVDVLDLVFSALREKVLNNLKNHAAPETRATPGQPWLRRWDNFKKGRDGPLFGNQ
ncbi:hypothetical protein LOK49_LG04G02373 [Camellia lanceoleosa]|uniref:Uncharacterized protein n=1 Tax=Camellia lanceoleosa TaxID=1840588 RepID=A0ACC0I2H6_9ERIC|nr:hypothetical protein LOK49_LG04G02373 [Camellia lanceoleosa]